MCNKAINRYFLVFDSTPNRYSEELFLIVYFPDKYITHKMCDEAVDGFLATLKLIPHWFVTSKMIKEPFTVLYTDENILYFNEDSGNVAFSCNEMDTLKFILNLKNTKHLKRVK